MGGNKQKETGIGPLKKVWKCSRVFGFSYLTTVGIRHSGGLLQQLSPFIKTYLLRLEREMLKWNCFRHHPLKLFRSPLYLSTTMCTYICGNAKDVLHISFFICSCISFFFCPYVLLLSALTISCSLFTSHSVFLFFLSLSIQLVRRPNVNNVRAAWHLLVYFSFYFKPLQQHVCLYLSSPFAFNHRQRRWRQRRAFVFTVVIWLKLFVIVLDRCNWKFFRENFRSWNLHSCVLQNKLFKKNLIECS